MNIEAIRKVVETFEEWGDTVWVNCPVSVVRLLLDEIDAQQAKESV